MCCHIKGGFVDVHSLVVVSLSVIFASGAYAMSFYEGTVPYWRPIGVSAACRQRPRCLTGPYHYLKPLDYPPHPSASEEISLSLSLNVK